jgi:hypothetical protein
VTDGDTESEIIDEEVNVFGHASSPSRVYSYGAKAPTQGADVVASQMSLAHKYRNVLVESELIRRKKVEEALRALSPELAETETALKNAGEALAAARAAINLETQQARKKVRPAELVAAANEAGEKRKALYARRKELRTVLFVSPAWKARQDEIDAWATEEQKRLRSQCGLYWATYLHVEQSMAGRRSGPPPRFMRWTGDGHLAVQLQGGMAVGDAFGHDPRLQIVPLQVRNLPTSSARA